MTNHNEAIAVGVDFSQSSEIALSHAADMAERSGAELLMLFLHSANAQLATAVAHHVEAAIRDHLGATRAALEAKRRELRNDNVRASAHLIAGDPKHELAPAAKQLGASLLVVGSRGNTGVKRWLMGSCAELSARKSEINVLVARGSDDARHRRILVPVDLSTQSRSCIEMALRLVEPTGAIDLLHCVERPFLGVQSAGVVYAADDAQREAEVLGEALLDVYRHRFPEISFEIAHGAPAAEIDARVSERPYDLVVMGCHGRTGIARWVLGSVAETTVRHAPCSVLVVKEDPK